MNKPIIAIMYDFDKTLCEKNMQEYYFIESVGHTDKEFWDECHEMQRKYKMDGILASMYFMLKKARGKSLFTEKSLMEQGKYITFYKGVKEWFSLINRYGAKLGYDVEHYIISSGLKKIIEGTSIAKEFKEIFASEFCYDEDGVAFWPAIVINYTSKLQYLYRVNKGILDVCEDELLNEVTPYDKRRVPFSNMIYIGDGMTDVPSMKITRANGGHSIGVYPEGNPQMAEKIYDAGRIDYMAEADYRDGSELCNAIKAIFDKIALKQ